jgi:hypothetical protein
MVYAQDAPHWNTTTRGPNEQQGAINDLLERRGVTQYQWTMGHLGEHDAYALRFVYKGNTYFIPIMVLPYREATRGKKMSAAKVRCETRKQALRALYVHLEALFDAEFFLPGQDALFAYREVQPNVNLAMLKDTSGLPDRPLLAAPFSDDADVVDGDFEEVKMD